MMGQRLISCIYEKKAVSFFLELFKKVDAPPP